MKNKKLIVLIALSVLAVLSIIHGLIQSGRESAKLPEKPADNGKGNAAVSEEISFAPLKPPAKSVYSSWGRNPFALPGERGASLEDLRLEGIMSDNNKFTAIIDDIVVGIGDNIQENKVIDIKPDRVILNDGKKDFELKLAQ
jgi:hypothetical protein